MRVEVKLIGEEAVRYDNVLSWFMEDGILTLCFKAKPDLQFCASDIKYFTDQC